MKLPLPDGLGLMLLTSDLVRRDSGWCGSARLAISPPSGAILQWKLAGLEDPHGEGAWEQLA